MQFQEATCDGSRPVLLHPPSGRVAVSAAGRDSACPSNVGVLSDDAEQALPARSSRPSQRAGEFQRAITAAVILLLVVPLAALADTVEFKTGASATGKITSYEGRNVVLEVVVGTKTLTRTYPKSRVKSITVDGRTFDPNSESGSGVTAASGRGERSKAEILAEIDAQGKTAPDWYESTPLDYPQSLDLSWPEPAPKPWNSSKNIGQYIWDRINPNANNWRGGVKFMHHILSTTDSADVRQRAMRTLGSMYHNLLQDYARSAFW